ncbi:DUF2242 domain-containing protein [Xenophilus arseniciresistens]|uniref:DUF2242 domain-containing protein n=1 Tax=Xenophilus arseniciresistens TaxID=1283306 RepID=A0AAE3NCW4_9BURK|nr:DUF2242 domain-containing protein [Xenophilus arseniciresistens]MDA7418903.1 DUF2242 domain-containing protein [Xenophilus arseniciresistens]
MPLLPAFRRAPAPVLLLASALLLSACTFGAGRTRSYATESFDSTTTHTRSFSASEAQTCEAARRALLSQGYFVSRAGEDQVAGRKQFQPAGEVHLDVEVRVVCVRDERQGRGSLAFATAVQDRYELKKASSSASVGVGALGSVSLPFNAGNDAMVKVASQTVTDDEFYTRFFVLLDEYLYVPPQTPRAEPAAQRATGLPRVSPVPAVPEPAAPAAAPEAVPVPLSPSRG